MMKKFENKKVLVTGATGLIGSCLVKTLLKMNAKVIAMGRSVEKLEAVFEEEKGNQNLSMLQGDISEGLSPDISKLDFIFHAASPIAGSEIKEKPVDVISANLSGTISCLELLKRQKEQDNKDGKMIVFSSATVYGNTFTEDTIVTEEDTRVADPLSGLNAPYSESKRMIEVIASSYAKQFDVDASIVRIGWVYGYTKKQPQTAFYEFINNAIAGNDICLNNSGMGKRDNIYVDDVVNGLLTVAIKGKKGEAYNLSSNNDLDNFMAIDEIAEIIASKARDVFDKNTTVKYKQKSDVRNPGIRMDNQKLIELGWKLENSIYDGIEKTIRAYMM